MLRRWVWPLLALMAASIGGTALAAEPAPVRIVAVGDLHGDYDAWEAIARAAGLVDAKGRWSGGSTTLVQLGDVVDRGPDSLKIINQLMRLQSEARRKRGQVVVIVGNHEAMNMTDDLRYVHPGEYAAFATKGSSELRDRLYASRKAEIQAAYRARTPTISEEAIRQAWLATMPLGKIEHQLAWAPDGRIGRWVMSNPAVAKIGDSLFVHGGISSAFATMPIADINRRVGEALRRRDEAKTSIINDPAGPLWYRGLVTRSAGDETSAAPVVATNVPPLSQDQEVALVLKSYGVKRIIVGHTPARGPIKSAFDGRLWPIDTAISRAYGGTLSWLEINGDRVTAHSIARPVRAAWGGAP